MLKIMRCSAIESQNKNQKSAWKTSAGMVLFVLVWVMCTACGKQPSASIQTMPQTQMQEVNRPEEKVSETESDTTEATEEPAEESPKYTIRMVGDVLLHTRVEEAALQEDGSYSFLELFSHTTNLIEEADLAIVNQEVILGGSELKISGYPCFNGPFEVADTLHEVGFDVVCHGTNHALDKGKKGILNCLSYWKENYPKMKILGIHDSKEDEEELCLVDTPLGRIAILNYTYGTNGIKLPEDMPYGVDYLEEKEVISDIARAKEAADFVIVCPHWGTEYELGTDRMQKKWSELFASNGVNLVIGTHPHVIEPIEWVDNTLIYYSLGNYVNWTSGEGKGVMNRMVGGMASITLAKEESGEIRIDSYEVIPLVTHVEEGINGVTVYPLREYTQELAKKNAIVKQDEDFSLENCSKLVRQVWGEGDSAK